MRLYGAACFHCLKPLCLRLVERDRIVPGGPYTLDNLVPACRDCNGNGGRGNRFFWLPDLSLERRYRDRAA